MPGQQGDRITLNLGCHTARTDEYRGHAMLIDTQHRRSACENTEGEPRRSHRTAEVHGSYPAESGGTFWTDHYHLTPLSLEPPRTGVAKSTVTCPICGAEVTVAIDSRGIALARRMAYIVSALLLIVVAWAVIARGLDRDTVLFVAAMAGLGVLVLLAFCAALGRHGARIPRRWDSDVPELPAHHRDPQLRHCLFTTEDPPQRAL